MISYDEALALVLDTAPPLPPETVSLGDCSGRALAVDVYADQDSPPFARAAMDGYAVSAQDVARAPSGLRVVEQIAAGQVPSSGIGPGECARIMTGAIVPDGADAVIMWEDTALGDGQRVIIQRPPKVGDNICRRGENYHQGDRLLTAGETLTPAHAAVLAAVGVSPVSVGRLPVVNMLATGNEVVSAECVPALGQVRDSNSAGFAALLAPLGISVGLLGIVPDEPEALRSAIAEGLAADVLAISAGVSQGDHDLVPAALRDLSVEILFETVAIKPGKPTLFGRRGHTLVFGLPGNPVSAQLATRLLVIPALRKMSGHAHHRLLPLTAHLTEPLSHKPGRRSFIPATVCCAHGCLLATPVAYRGSGDLLGLSRGNALILLGESVPSLAAGAEVPILPTAPGLLDQGPGRPSAGPA